jgi:hypothetical protein
MSNDETRTTRECRDVFFFSLSLLSVIYKLNLLQGSYINWCVDTADDDNSKKDDDFDWIFNVYMRERLPYGLAIIDKRQKRWWVWQIGLEWEREKGNSIDAYFSMTDWWDRLSLSLTDYSRLLNILLIIVLNLSLSSSSK